MSAGHDRFAALARPLLAREGIARGKMMGFPCLRSHGRFFASVHRDGSALIVKLPEERVKACIATGEGVPFAPNGRVFREWLAVPLSRADTWPAMLERALASLETP